MMLKKWDKLPEEFKNDDVKKYYDLLSKKRVSLLFKRIFDIAVYKRGNRVEAVKQCCLVCKVN